MARTKQTARKMAGPRPRRFRRATSEETVEQPIRRLDEVEEEDPEVRAVYVYGENSAESPVLAPLSPGAAAMLAKRKDPVQQGAGIGGWLSESSDSDTYSMESVGDKSEEDEDDSTAGSGIRFYPGLQHKVRAELYHDVCTELHNTKKDLERAVYVVRRQRGIINDLKRSDLPPKKRPSVDEPEAGPSRH